jgi:hypothetical protein
MSTLGLDSILSYVIADPANGSFADLGIGEGICIRSTFQDEIGMASHLPHASYPGSSISLLGD